MRKFVNIIMLIGMLIFSTNVFAAQTANQLVTFTIGAANEISIAGDPGLMEILAPAAGEDPVPVTDNSTSISYSTNSSNKKITGQLSTDMPNGVSLLVHIASPGGAQGLSQGNQNLTSSLAANLVTGISKAIVQNATITYTLSSTLDADPTDNAARTVTFTMTSD